MDEVTRRFVAQELAQEQHKTTSAAATGTETKGVVADTNDRESADQQQTSRSNDKAATKIDADTPEDTASSAPKRTKGRGRRRHRESGQVTGADVGAWAEIGRLREDVDHEDEVERMKQQFAALLGKWSELQRRPAAVDSETSPSSHPTSTSTLTDTESSNQFLRRRSSRSASPPPPFGSMPRMGELSISSMMPLGLADAAQRMSVEDEVEDDAQDLQTAQMHHGVSAAQAHWAHMQ